MILRPGASMGAAGASEVIGGSVGLADATMRFHFLFVTCIYTGKLFVLRLVSSNSLHDRISTGVHQGDVDD